MIHIPRKTYDDCEKPRHLIPEGRHVLEILDVEGTDASEFMLVKYRTVLPVPGMEGEEKFFMSLAAMKRFAILAKRGGLQARGEDASEAIGVDPEDLIGTQWVVDFTHEHFTYERGSMKGQPGVKHVWAGFAGFWPMDHPDVADYVRSLSTRRTAAPVAQAPRTQSANGNTQAAPVTHDDEV